MHKGHFGDPSESRLWPPFDPAFYRAFNIDLNAAGLSDPELRAHFEAHGRHERRPYAATTNTADQMSMKWLRGKGLEIGAGDLPTRLFGDAVAVLADKDASLAFGGSGAERYFDIEGVLPEGIEGAYDFVVASHVLEHCNSVIRAFENLVRIVRPGGIVYIVVPDIRYLPEQRFMPHYDFAHHTAEYVDALRFRAMHDQLHAAQRGADLHANDIELIDEAYAQGLAVGEIPERLRFIYHKHNYTFGDWTRLLVDISQFYGPATTLEDAAFGRARMDCHFVFERRTAAAQT